MPPHPFPPEVAGSQVARFGDLAWVTGETPGVRTATLFRNAATGEYTALVEMQPGTDYPPHSHDLLEEVLVLEGVFADSEHTYRKGDYVIRAPGAVHTSAAHEHALVLVTYRAI